MIDQEKSETGRGYDPTFAIGDSAILNSGGPVMAVIGISPSGRIWCEWQAADGTAQDASFDQRMLRRG